MGSKKAELSPKVIGIVIGVFALIVYLVQENPDRNVIAPVITSQNSATPIMSEQADEVARVKANEAIEALGGFVGSNPDGPVYLSNTKVTDAGLRELAGLKNLQVLYLVNTQVTDAGLKELAGLKNLQTLLLGSTKVTDAGLKELARFKNLRRLDLIGTQVTDVGLKELASLKGLQTLEIGSTKVTDAGLKELAGLKGLQILFHGKWKSPEKIEEKLVLEPPSDIRQMDGKLRAIAGPGQSQLTKEHTQGVPPEEVKAKAALQAILDLIRRKEGVPSAFAHYGDKPFSASIDWTLNSKDGKNERWSGSFTFKSDKWEVETLKVKRTVQISARFIQDQEYSHSRSSVYIKKGSVIPLVPYPIKPWWDYLGGETPQNQPRNERIADGKKMDGEKYQEPGLTIFTREDFKSRVMGQQSGGVIENVGKPNSTVDNGLETVLSPNGGFDRIPVVHWVYEKRTKDSITGKIDRRATVTISGRLGYVTDVSFSP